MYKYLCKNKKTNIVQWLDEPCKGWKVIAKKFSSITESGLKY